MKPSASEKPSLHQIIMLVLSIGVVLGLLLRELVPLHEDTHQLLNYVDTGICLYFLYDFFLRLYQSAHKWPFVQQNWIDLLASIPVVPWLRLGQVVRIIRLMRMIRVFRTTQEFVRYFFHNRANGTLTVVLLSALLLMIFGAIAILSVERVLGANIKTPADALWWAFVTITTVGYGDRYPITTAGRLIAAVLMVVGVGLFGTFTGYVANFFVEEDQEPKESELQTLIKEVQQLRTKIEELEKNLK
ncbi:potassium channel family protein [Spirosoma sp. KUDC1026]|uniref:potassium channel family protein n=1 Tax=Spirosoma sp. KUDC1026 TaxID=2745947 RepID=UPI00159BDAAB|nr:potassium channel family protein [Spirosoma sp. KUDC1026]QKZ12176.1 potassium channel family protein [Spirosoma sp. KUDC1026]